MVRKTEEIKNGKQYIALEISLMVDFMDKREVTSSESRAVARSEERR